MAHSFSDKHNFEDMLVWLKENGIVVEQIWSPVNFSNTYPRADAMYIKNAHAFDASGAAARPIELGIRHKTTEIRELLIELGFHVFRTPRKDSSGCYLTMTITF